MEYAFLTDCRIDVPTLVALVETPEAGAIASFLGTSRATSHDRSRREREVQTLWYEAYGPMALRRLREIAADAHRRFDVRHVAVVHRTGEVPVGETSVAIAVSAAHRGPAFDACRWVIDEIKRSVPIWKRERFADGEEWVEGCAGDAAAGGADGGRVVGAPGGAGDPPTSAVSAGAIAEGCVGERGGSCADGIGVADAGAGQTSDGAPGCAATGGAARPRAGAR